MPKVSVVIASYNSAGYLGETLRSVLGQTFRDFEVLLVDDGSTDETAALVASIDDPRINYLYQTNSGAPARPRNLGISRSTGQYISIFDSDDLMLPCKLEKAVDFLDRCCNVGMVFSDLVQFDEDGERGSRWLAAYSDFHAMPKTKVAPQYFIIASQVAFHGLFVSNYIGTSGVVMRREVLDQVGLFDESVSMGGLEDRDLWFRITRRHDIGYIDDVCHKYRLRDGGVSRRLVVTHQNRVEVMRRYLSAITCEATRKRARESIAKSLYSAGYQLLEQVDLATARSFFVKSLYASWNRPALRGIAISLLGSRLYRRLRRARSG